MVIYHGVLYIATLCCDLTNMVLVRSKCKECLGSGICPHKRRKSTCKECGGSQICEHGRRRARCKDCLGSGI